MSKLKTYAPRIGGYEGVEFFGMGEDPNGYFVDVDIADEILEALIQCYEHMKNNYQQHGINERAKDIIEKATGKTIKEILNENN